MQHSDGVGVQNGAQSLGGFIEHELYTSSETDGISYRATAFSWSLGKGKVYSEIRGGVRNLFTLF